jgi:CxxC motif-containing protein
MEKRNLTCIVCPLGCAIMAEIEDSKVVSVSGNTCKRGEEYVRAEIADPRRTLTTTVRTADGGRVPVKSSAPLPKALLMDAMKRINAIEAKAPVRAGDVLVGNIFDTGIDIVATDAYPAG